MPTTPAAKLAAPLVLSDDSTLVEELLRLCAAASVTPEVLRTLSRVRRSWASASCVLIGADMSAAIVRLDLPRRTDVILTSHGPETADLWQAAVALRADHVAVVPQAQQWLVERLADCLDGDAGGAFTIAVMGARGGAGASILAAGLALGSGRRGVPTMLIDLDPLGGGIELVVGCEERGGLRWPEVANTHGRVSATALRDALPSVEGVSILSWNRLDEADVQFSTVRAMLTAGQRGSSVVVLDLARRFDDVIAHAISAADVLVLVSTSDVRSTAGAARMCATLRPLTPDIRLVVRVVPGGQLEPSALAEALHLSLLATVPTQRTVARAINDGLGPPRRGRFADRCGRVLDELSVVRRSPR